jgi:lysine/ornithine N-monooxygenase
MLNNIFIIGCGHSGTTILNKIISNHKDIYGLNYETSLFYESSHENIIKKINTFNSERIKLGKKYFCEKTPNHVYKINQIYKYTINPKIIVITRDGRDVVASLKKRYNDFNMSLNRWINDNNEWLNSSYINNFQCIIIIRLS